jgi:YggT family protein
MDALLYYTEFVVQALISLLIWIVIIYVILSWLISFDAVNMRNRFVYRIAHLLDSVATPLLRPFRRILPGMGGLDFSPILFVVLVGGAQRFLIPALFGWLHGLVNGGVPS